MFDWLGEKRIKQTLADFENKNIKNPREAWKLIKELSGKTKSVTYIQGENRLGTWKDYFYKPLSADNATDIDVEIEQVSELHPEISMLNSLPKKPT